MILDFFAKLLMGLFPNARIGCERVLAALAVGNLGEVNLSVPFKHALPPDDETGRSNGHRGSTRLARAAGTAEQRAQQLEVLRDSKRTFGNIYPSERGRAGRFSPPGMPLTTLTRTTRLPEA